MWTRGHTTVALGATAMTGTALYFSTYWSPTQIFAEDSVQPRTAAGIPPNSSYPPTMKIYDKELPVVTVFDDDTADLGKPRLVILGSGWGATSLLKVRKIKIYIGSSENPWWHLPTNHQQLDGGHHVLIAIYRICSRMVIVSDTSDDGC